MANFFGKSFSFLTRAKPETEQPEPTTPPPKANVKNLVEHFEEEIIKTAKTNRVVSCLNRKEARPPPPLMSTLLDAETPAEGKDKEREISFSDKEREISFSDSDEDTYATPIARPLKVRGTILRQD